MGPIDRCVAAVLACGALATASLAGPAEARTVSSGAQAASTLVLLLAYAHQPAAVAAGAPRGDPSRSSGQLRRLALQLPARR